MFRKAFIAGLAFCTQVGIASDSAFPSTYKPLTSEPTIIRNATILTGDGKRLENADLYFDEGRIVWVGSGEAADNSRVIDAEGRWVTPGIIDVHSHLGVYPSPDVDAHSDGNEATAPVTAEVWKAAT